MKRLLLKGLVRPLLERLGTIGTTLLVTSGGFDGDLATQFVAAVLSACLLGLDLLMAKQTRMIEAREDR